MREWLDIALGDARTAERELVAAPDPNYRAVCFHAQQAIEKAMKAALAHSGVTAPYTHDLVVLSGALTSIHAAWSWSASELRQLSLGAVDYRYPGQFATKSEAEEAVLICRRAWVVIVTLL